MYKLNKISLNIKNIDKINEFNNVKKKILNFLIDPYLKCILPNNFFIIYLFETKYYYLIQSTIDNDIICLDIFLNDNFLKKLIKNKNNIFKFNVSNGVCQYNLLPNNDLYISPIVNSKFFKYF